MTEELQHSLQAEMRDALRIEESDRRHDAILTVLVHQNDALIDCQRKTADRVKKIVKERDSVKERVKGAKFMIEILRIIAQAGGTAAIVKFLNFV